MTAHERIQSAINLLKPLAEREGLPGKITLGLCRASLRLEQSVQKPDAVPDEAARGALKELRSCRARIQKAPQTVDAGVAAQLEQVLALLVPLQGTDTDGGGVGKPSDAGATLKAEPSKPPSPPAASTAPSRSDPQAETPPSAPAVPAIPGLDPQTLALSARGSAAAEQVRALRKLLHAARASAALEAPAEVGDSADGKDAAPTPSAEQVQSPSPPPSPAASAAEVSTTSELGRRAVPASPAPTGDEPRPFPSSEPDASENPAGRPAFPVPPPEAPQVVWGARAGSSIVPAPSILASTPLAPAQGGAESAASALAPAEPETPAPRVVGDVARRLDPFLSDLGRAYLQVARVYENPLSTLEELEVADARLRRLAPAARWFDDSAISYIEKVALDGPETWDRLMANVALVHAGVAASGPRLLASVFDEDGALVAPVVLSRLAEDLDLLSVLSSTSSSGQLRALVLPILAEKQALSRGQVETLLRDDSDEIAAAAAQVVAWIGSRDLAHDLLVHARKSKSPLRTNAFLFASVALGCRDALAEVQARLARDVPDPLLLDALAVGGGEPESELLMAHACKSPDFAGRLVLAAASLGAERTAGGLQGLADRVAGDALAEARRWVLGDGAAAGAGNGRRLLCGAPWSIPAAIARLCTSDSPIALIRRIALEVCVRSGTEPSAYVSPYAHARRWAQLGQAWKAAFARPERRLQPGGWYYFGRPCPKAA